MRPIIDRMLDPSMSVRFQFLFAALLLAWTWRSWPDPLVDFGRELYSAWRLAEGELLHRDLAWFNGPLSVWWNAAWFELAGVSFTTLIWVNLGLTALNQWLVQIPVERRTETLWNYEIVE